MVAVSSRQKILRKFDQSVQSLLLPSNALLLVHPSRTGLCSLRCLRINGILLLLAWGKDFAGRDPIWDPFRRFVLYSRVRSRQKAYRSGIGLLVLLPDRATGRRIMTGNPIVLQAFTQLASDYERTMDRELRGLLGVGYKEFVARLVEAASIREGDWVLDVATGTGSIPLEVADQVGPGGGVVGLDITPNMLERAHNHLVAAGSPLCIRLVCASGVAMPFFDSVFDVIVCGFGTHHMHVPWLLSEMGRVLKPGGRLLLMEAGAPAYWRAAWATALLNVALFGYALIHRRARAQAEVDAFQNIRTAEEWRTDLSDAGFTKVEVIESRGRRPWHPRVFEVQAVAESI